MFWGDIFDYGAALAAKSVDPTASPWPGVWAPPAVVEGWRGTNLAAYETDFYHNIVSLTPEMRQVYGAGEMFLGGIDSACAARNMTAQLCAGNPPSFLEALTMPSITNARASIDYDWDGAPPGNSGARSNNGYHNWAAPDNSWVFWATRIAPSKDNFWTSFRDLSVAGGGQDSGRNGKDAELHAINALLLTGPVGLGDTCVGGDCMTNATLVRRLARADGVLLRPDRPMAAMDVMFAGLLDNPALRAMPGLCTVAQESLPSAAAANASCGARLWQTHATVYPEDPRRAPELATAPTRRLLSHAGVDATAQRTIPEALTLAPSFLLQHLVRSVDQPDSFRVRLSDLYPVPAAHRTTNNPTATAVALQVLWRVATDGGSKCVAGSDAVASGCIGLVANANASADLFDISTAGFHCAQEPYLGSSDNARVGLLPAGPNCQHQHGLWQVWTVDGDADFVLLGDLSAYVSLSGYRFRLPSQTPAGARGDNLVVVGMPGERVPVTYLRKATGGSWRVLVQLVTVGAGGRAEVTLK